MPIIKDVAPEDDFRPAYEGAFTAQQRAQNEEWLRSISGGSTGAGGASPSDPAAPGAQPAAGSGETVLPMITVTPEGDGNLPEGEGFPSASGGLADLSDEEGNSLLDAAGAALSAVPAIGKDLLRGGSEAIPQVFGGIVDAIGEVDQFMQSVLPIGGARLFDEEGNFSPALVGPDGMVDAEKAGQTLFDMVTTDEADSVTGGIIRSASQFLVGFIPGMQASRAIGLGKIAAGFTAGAIADAVVMDPYEDRLSTFLNQIPALEPLVWDYLADNNSENQSQWEGRLKNAIEGAGIGATTEIGMGLIKAFKYYKAQRAANIEAPKDPRAIAVRDQQQAVAAAEIGNNVTDDMLRPLGDTSPDAPLLIEAKPDETLPVALDRLREAETRAKQMEEQGVTIARVKELMETRKRRISQGPQVPSGDTAEGLTLRKHPEVDEDGTTAIEIMQNGEVVGVAYVRQQGDEIRVDNILSHKSTREGSYNSFGTSAMRQLARQARDLFPGAEYLSGSRVGGARFGGEHVGIEAKGKETRVRLPAPSPSVSKVPSGDTMREPIDDALDELRSGAVSKARFPARPVANIVRQLGGVDPNSSLAGDLRSRGITAKSFPGLFKRGGRESLDNIPGSEHPLFMEHGRVTDDGYIDQGAFVDALEAELKGDPWRLADERQMIDEIVAPAHELEEQLSRLGIDYENMSNDAVKRRLQEIVDEQEDWIRYQEQTASRVSDEAGSRTYAELVQETDEYWSVQQIEEARQAGVDDAIIAAHTRPKVYINMARIQGAEDVKALIQTMADADAAHIKDKTRGVVSNDQTIKESSQEFRDLNDLIGRKPGPMNAAQAVAARRILASSAEQVQQLAKIAASPNAGQADLYNFRRALSVHAAIQAEVIGARTETARALQSWSIPIGASKARTDAISELIKTNTGKDLQKLANAMSNLNSEAGINAMARQTVALGVQDALFSVYVNGLLYGPKTHVVNAMSNAAVALYAIPERYAAAGFSNAFGRGDIAMGEASAMAYGMLEGARDGVRLMVAGPKAAGVENLGEMWEMFGKQEARPNPISGAAFGMDPNNPMYRGLDVMGSVLSLPGTFLERADLFFKSLNYRMELHAQAYREAAQSGLEGKEFAEKVADTLANPPAHLVEQANKMALINTFTNPLGEAGRYMQMGITKTGLRWFMPFVRTPTNIMKYTFARTPLAYASAGIRADIAAGGARAAQAHARVAMGTMLMMTFAGSAIDGHMTGGGPLDHKLNKAWRAAGNQPYSVKIGDRWYAYNRLDPLGMMLGMAADLAEISTSPKGEGDEAMIFAAGITAFAQNMLSKTYAQGAFELAAALDPRNPAGDPSDLMVKQVGGLVPFSSLLRQTAQFLDPEVREARDTVVDENGEVDEIASFLNRLVNNSKRGIPGLSDTLPPVRDLFGEPLSNESGIGWAWDMVIPISSKAAETDPVAKAIVDNEVKVDRPDRKVAGVQLDAEQYDELQTIAGPMVRQALEGLISSPGFKNLSTGPDGMQAQVIKRTVQQMHETARNMLLMRDPKLRETRMNKMRKTQNLLLGN